MSVIQMFKETPMRNQVVPYSALPGQYAVSVDSAENKALRLAESSDFFSMCSASLWGDENVSEFGEMLRGAVENFKPKNYWQLTLLVNVCDAQWKVIRIRKLQRSLYKAQPYGAGKDGVPLKTEKAVSYESLLTEHVNALNSAIRVYNQSSAEERRA